MTTVFELLPAPFWTWKSLFEWNVKKTCLIILTLCFFNVPCVYVLIYYFLFYFPTCSKTKIFLILRLQLCAGDGRECGKILSRTQFHVHLFLSLCHPCLNLSLLIFHTWYFSKLCFSRPAAALDCLYLAVLQLSSECFNFFAECAHFSPHTQVAKSDFRTATAQAQIPHVMEYLSFRCVPCSSTWRARREVSGIHSVYFTCLEKKTFAEKMAACGERKASLFEFKCSSMQY